MVQVAPAAPAQTLGNPPRRHPPVGRQVVVSARKRAKDPSVPDQVEFWD
ncbi:MAG: hypothetical protein AAB676_11995 [Verrucomicrobiota bacterium]